MTHLARLEGRKLIVSPAFLAGVGIALLGGGIFLSTAGNPDASWADDSWTMAAGFILLAILSMIATNRAVLRDHREHTAEQHSSLPLAPQIRTQGTLLAIAAPTGAAAALLGIMVMVAATKLRLSSLQALHALQLPLLVVLLGTLGTTLARWVPSAFVAPAAAIFFYVVSPGDSTPRSWHVIWPFATPDSAGLATWHLVYVLGVAAVLGVVAVGRDGWSRRLTAAGIVALTTTAVSLLVMMARVCPPTGRCLL